MKRHYMMESQKVQSTFLSELALELRQLWRSLSFAIGGAGIALRNAIRRARRLKVDYVVLPLSGSLPERAGPPRGFIQRRLPFPDPPLTMELLNSQLRAVADAENVSGVVFIFQGMTAGLATLQNVRRAIERLQEAGKKVVIFTPFLDMPHYFVAAAADKIVVPPMARFEVIGIRSETVFLKDALERIGIKADVVQISPFKTAYNELAESDITPEQEQQLNWILDDAYDQVTSALASGRNMSTDAIKALIDQAPMSAERARETGLLDHIAYEDALPQLLANEGREPSTSGPAAEAIEETGQTSTAGTYQEAKLLTWSDAQSVLIEKRRYVGRKHIGVVSLEGAISMGASRRSPLPIPFLTGRTSGEATLSDTLRRAEKDSRLAALIVQIDSGGGSALASDLIWRQVDRIARRLPVIAYLGNVAASGGYYVAAAGRHIMSQPLTLTGSIGVVTVHISTKGLFEQLSVKRVSLKRGERANLTSDIYPLDEEEKQILWTEVSDTYQRFKDIVADSREIAEQRLEEIGEGRVWTGRQALDRNLVDAYGDFQDAIAKAAELAGIQLDDRHDVEVRNLFPSGSGHVLPRPLEEPAELLGILTQEQVAAYLDKPLLIMPMEITLR